MAKPKACFYLLACLLLRPEGYFTDAQGKCIIEMFHAFIPVPFYFVKFAVFSRVSGPAILD